MSTPDMLVFDASNMMEDRLGSGKGIGPRDLERAAPALEKAHQEMLAQLAAGTLGFARLLADDKLCHAVNAQARKQQGRYEDVVVLGIGGSALGTSALFRALCSPLHNHDPRFREKLPRLWVLDNIDPRTLSAYLELWQPDRTLVNVVTKSGTTVETMSQFLLLKDWLKSRLGSRYQKHIVATTDPANGLLRQIAREEKLETLPIPPEVGGRFSVLSAVGLFPAALVGIDIEQLLEGAREIWREVSDPARAATNPSSLFAATQHLLTRKGHPIHVLMAYADSLYLWADWWRQLWAESLGKRLDRTGKKEVWTGPTPVKALGPTDQHSQVQLYVEGPADKTVTFLTEKTSSSGLAIPDTDLGELSYLSRKTFKTLNDAEQQGTEIALTKRGCPNARIELSRVSAATVGQLVIFFEAATALAGSLWQVNPYDQPGVEGGKIAAYALLGRRGYDTQRKELERLLSRL